MTTLQPTDKRVEDIVDEILGIGMNAYVDWAPSGEEEYKEELTKIITQHHQALMREVVEAVKVRYRQTIPELEGADAQEVNAFNDGVDDAYAALTAIAEKHNVQL